jgi:hypothetical protein
MATLMTGGYPVEAQEEGTVRIQIGDRMPRLEGEYLTGEDAVLPEAARGKVAFVALGFTYDSRYAVEPWAAWFREEFGDDASATFFEVPMIGGLARLGKWFIDGGMRRGTPEQFHNNVITVYGGTGEWKDRVGFEDEDWAYLLILDRDGTVRHMHAGYFEEKEVPAVREALRLLLDRQ